MTLITPRRRLLFTAPLAVLLPAGLIAYLGLWSVGYLDVTLSEVVNSDIFRHKDTVEALLIAEMNHRNREFGTAFRLWIEERTAEGWTPRARDLGERLVLKMPLPFSQYLFCSVVEGEVVFYCRQISPEDQPQGGVPPESTTSVWVKCTPPSQKLAEMLIDTAIRPSLPLQIQEDLPFLTLAPFGDQTVSGDHVLVANTSFQVGTSPDSQIVTGFIYDLDYVLRYILQPILRDTRVFLDTYYPLQVVDKENRVIATNLESQPIQMDSNYFTDPISLYLFPFWKLRYAKDAGVKTKFRPEEFRRILIPLIISAAVIMVLAVVGLIRNLISELRLAEMRSNFVARVSHELRTPLGLIRLFAETLEMGRIEDNQRRREYLHTITRESERLSKLIDNVLDFSKIEAGQKQYRLSLGSIGDIVEDVTDSMRFHMSRNNLDLKVEVEPNLPMLRMDREAMAQALWNLLSNAVKYSGNGRVVEVEARRADGEVVLSVRDHGIGIAPHEMKRICQQFYRVNDPRVRERGGSGLGLSVVKHIIEGHNGRLVIDSAPGKGSTFSLCLPIPGGRSETPPSRAKKEEKTS